MASKSTTTQAAPAAKMTVKKPRAAAAADTAKPVKAAKPAAALGKRMESVAAAPAELSK